MSVNHSGKEVGFIFASENTQPVADTPVVSGPTGGPWRCFHCDELCLTEADAEHHFGRQDGCEPICQVAAETYRALEREVAAYRSDCDADTVLFYRLGADHATAVRNAEQAGYDRGLSDARYSDLVEAATVLRELFCGDTVHMALAGNPIACERMEHRIAVAVAKSSPIIGTTTTLEARPSGYRGSDAPNLPTRET